MNQRRFDIPTDFFHVTGIRPDVLSLEAMEVASEFDEFFQSNSFYHSSDTTLSMLANLLETQVLSDRDAHHNTGSCLSNFFSCRPKIE
jgi:hypothetical protein